MDIRFCVNWNGLLEPLVFPLPIPISHGRLLDLISHKVFLKPFCRSHPPYKSVNLFFISLIMKDKLTDWCGL